MSHSVQATAKMHGAIKISLNAALSAFENGGDIPWSELEAALEEAVQNGVASQADLDEVRAKHLNVERLKEILAKVVAGYGTQPKLPPRI